MQETSKINPLQVKRHPRSWLVGLALMFAIAAAIWTIAFVVRLENRRLAESKRSQDNLKWIASSLNSYSDVHEWMPPPYRRDAQGNPAQSWRLLIASHIEEPLRFKQYSFAEPWNGPSNRQLLLPTPRAFRSPIDDSSPEGMTNYVLITGDRKKWPGRTQAGMADSEGEGGFPLLIVEIGNSDIPWLEPRDIRMEELGSWLESQKAGDSKRIIRGGVVTYQDRTYRLLDGESAIRRLHNLLSGNHLDEAAKDWYENLRQKN